VTEARVLLVEDEVLNRELVRAILARTTDPVVRALALVEAPTLADARAALAEQDVDVVLLDLNLPDGHGLALAAELAEVAHRPRVIALTASVLPQERAAAVQAGCDGFLDKPYVAADLVRILGQHLAARGGG